MYAVIPTHGKGNTISNITTKKPSNCIAYNKQSCQNPPESQLIK